jgi:hypothetical protein
MTVEEIKYELKYWRFSRYKAINLIIGFGILLLHELIARPVYRPYIYSHKINDYHIADTLGNSLGTIAAGFVSTFILTSNYKKGKEIMVFVVFIFILYELMQPMLGRKIDPWDIIATVIAGFFSLLTFNLLFNKPEYK